MLLLILGILLWVVPHLFKRLAPDMRAGMGDKGKGPVALAIVLGIVLMVIGYRGAEFVPVYTPLPGMGHLNNTLMLVSVFLFGVGGTKGTLYTRMRHPMLWGTVIWAVAHLLVNGDSASVVLFGDMPWVLPEAGRDLALRQEVKRAFPSTPASLASCLVSLTTSPVISVPFNGMSLSSSKAVLCSLVSPGTLSWAITDSMSRQ